MGTDGPGAAAASPALPPPRKKRRDSGGAGDDEADASGSGGGPLAHVSWVEELESRPGMQHVFSSHGDRQDVSHSSLAAREHYFASMLRNNMITAALGLYDVDCHTMYSAYQLGGDVCGHPGTVHGGLTSALLDEACGALLYSARDAGRLSFGLVYTARLEVDYKLPLPAPSTVLATTRVESAEGRKIWVACALTDRPAAAGLAGAAAARPAAEVITYAAGRALFVIPKAEQGSVS